MRKRLAITSLYLASLSSITLADSDHHMAHKDMFTGPYMGTSVGVTMNQGKHTFHTTGGQLLQSMNTSSTGVEGSIFFGIDRLCQNFFWGLEGHGAYNSGNSDFKVDPAGQGLLDYTLKDTWNVGVGGRFGRVICEGDAGVYLTFSVDWQWYKYKAPYAFTGHKNFNKVMLTPGIGIEKKLTDHLNGRLEFTHAMGLGSKKFPNNSTPFIRLNTQTSTIKLGLVWEF